jgi:acetylornithine deacetylase/succinyl-diaminopimelate desuccinylase-like protein
MMKVIEAVEGIHLEEHPLLGPAIFALTDIISEPYPGYSVIPSRCKATYDRRLLPDETAEGVLDGIRNLPELVDIPVKAVIAEGEHQAYTGNTLTCTKFFPAWILDVGHPLVQAALKGLRASGLNPRLSAYRFCTNAAYSVGTAGVPTVGFGPGTEADAHVVDERLSLEALEAVAQGYAGIIQSVLSE